MPNDDIEKAIRNAARMLRGKQTPKKLFSILQELFSHLEKEGNNDMASLVQASAICQILSEIALINNNSIRSI